MRVQTNQNRALVILFTVLVGCTRAPIKAYPGVDLPSDQLSTLSTVDWISSSSGEWEGTTHVISIDGKNSLEGHDFVNGRFLLLPGVHIIVASITYQKSDPTFAESDMNRAAPRSSRICDFTDVYQVTLTMLPRVTYIVRGGYLGGKSLMQVAEHGGERSLGERQSNVILQPNESKKECRTAAGIYDFILPPQSTDR